MLNRIVAAKHAEIAERKVRTPEAELRGLIESEPIPPSFRNVLSARGLNVIAEIKYRSPSRGRFRCGLPPEGVAAGYLRAGARALSILTDEPFFGGSPENLQRVRRMFEAGDRDERIAPAPLLRKDFLVDRYQLLEARAWGASAALLIVACLEPGPLKDLVSWSRDLELDPLVEVHDRFELDRALAAGADLIGVNNRNLKTFDVDLRTSFEIARQLEGEEGLLLVAESGLSELAQLLELRDAGYGAFLIGGAFMDTDDPGAALASLFQNQDPRAL